MPKLDIHLHQRELARAEAGQMNLFIRIGEALPGWEVSYHRMSLNGPVNGPEPDRRGYSLWWMMTPPVPRGLTLRRAYWFPFWRIETTNDRWDFDVARKAFPAEAIDPVAARQFCLQLRARILPDLPAPTREGFLFAPLQGHLQECRSFQAMSPIEMIETTLARDRRPLHATLHPKETYEAADLQALTDIARRFPRFTLDKRPSEMLLAACDGLVTENSALALSAALIGKPAVLFAKIDFHHVFGSVPRDGVAAAFRSLREAAPDFERYLYWFLQIEALNAGRPDFGARLRERLGALGWPVGPKATS